MTVDFQRVRHSWLPIMTRHSQIFGSKNINQFNKKLDAEMKLLRDWFNDAYFTEHKLEGGFELECLLLDEQYELYQYNTHFLRDLNCNYVVPEIGTASIEINTDHYLLQGDSLSMYHSGIEAIYQLCHLHAIDRKLHVLMIGSYPCASEKLFENRYVTEASRYKVLNEHYCQLNAKWPLQIDIEGREKLSIMPPSWAIGGLINSFQIHMRFGFSESVRIYNAALVVAASVLAVSCNSPYFMCKDLWAETRVPVYEGITDLPILENGEYYPCTTFGFGYLQKSFYELYLENQLIFPRLIPEINPQADVESMWHVKRQNSVVYRWVRPVLDFGPSGYPHLRIEFRPLSSGPSIVDMVANAALLFGLLAYYSVQDEPPESKLAFESAKQNYYQAAKFGLAAKLEWFNRQTVDVTRLLLDELVPCARQGLQSLKINPKDIDYYLGVIVDRVQCQQTGGVWQRRYIERYPSDYAGMIKCYVANQSSGLPVHEWEV